MDKKNIYMKIAEIASRMGPVNKGLVVVVGKGSYKAIGEADVLAAVVPMEAEMGIMSYPADMEIVESGEIRSIGNDGKEKVQMYVRVKVTYKFVNLDNVSEFIEVTAFGDGVDSQDKAPGKAMTYACKYALMKAYKIVGEDPDQEASQPLKGQSIGPIRGERLERRLEKIGVNVPKLLQSMGVQRLGDIGEEQYRKLDSQCAAKEAR